MNLLNSLRNRIIQTLSNPIHKASLQTLNPFNGAFLWGSGNSTHYDVNGQSYVDKGYNYNSFVYSIINQQATKTASIPYHVKKIEDKNAMKRLEAFELATKHNYTPQQQIRKVLLESKAYGEDYMPFPMERPNATQTWTEVLALYKTFMKLTGNCYFYLLSPSEGMNAGTPIQVYVLPSQFMQIVIKQNADMLSVESPIKEYMLIQSKSYITFEAEKVIHVKYPNPNYSESGEHLYGQSPLRSALRNIQSSNTAVDLNIKTLKSGGAFGFIHGKSTALTEAQAKEIKQRLLEMNGSPEDLSKIAGVSTEVGFTRLSLTSDELKPFDFLKFDKQEIADVLNWSIDDSNRGDFGGTINEIKKTRITDNIAPDLDLLTDKLNAEFLPLFKGYEKSIIKFDFTELPEMQADIKDLVLWLKDALDRGVITRNEFRQAIRYVKSDDKNMDEYTVNTETMSLDEALNQDFTINQ
jgi:hypothetical protein